MGLLLFLVGLLSAISGGFKLRERVRATVGSSRLARAEVLAGALVVLASGLGLARSGVAPWVVTATLALVSISSFDQGRRALRHRKSREQSEATRLRHYLRAERNGV